MNKSYWLILTTFSVIDWNLHHKIETRSMSYLTNYLDEQFCTFGINAGSRKMQVSSSQRSPLSRLENEALYERLKRAQRGRLEDQRGTEINFELPDFLKVPRHGGPSDAYTNSNEIPIDGRASEPILGCRPRLLSVSHHPNSDIYQVRVIYQINPSWFCFGPKRNDLPHYAKMCL